VHITRKFLSSEFCGSYAPLNLKISRNILLKQLVTTTPLVPMILKEFCSSEINGLVIKNFFREIVTL
jgi:hypothetical protein